MGEAEINAFLSHLATAEKVSASTQNQALAALRRLDAAGCVVLGEPAYYARFGFQTMPTLYLAGVPAAYFQALSFNSGRPAGEVRYHPAFTAA